MDEGARRGWATKNHRERGPKRFSFTYEDIARARGCAVSTVMHHATGATPRFDPRDLASVARYIVGPAPARAGE